MEYQISQVATSCGINKETIRYYERIGLLQVPQRNESGYRIYSQITIDRLNFIKRMQNLGFSLSEVHKLLGVVDRDEARCEDMFNFVTKKITQVELQIRDLQKIKEMLMELKEKCPDEKKLHTCPIIETLIEP